MTDVFTQRDARRVLGQAREDIAALLSRNYESLEEQYRLLEMNSELWRGLLKEDPPEYQARMTREAAG